MITLANYFRRPNIIRVEMGYGAKFSKARLDHVKRISEDSKGCQKCECEKQIGVGIKVLAPSVILKCIVIGHS